MTEDDLYQEASRLGDYVQKSIREKFTKEGEFTIDDLWEEVLDELDKRREEG